MATQPTPTPAPKAEHSPPTEGKPAEPEKKEPPVLDPEQALALFRNGDRICKVGDPKEKWFTQGRANDGTAVVETPLTDEFLKSIKDGKFYLSSHG